MGYYSQVYRKFKHVYFELDFHLICTERKLSATKNDTEADLVEILLFLMASPAYILLLVSRINPELSLPDLIFSGIILTLLLIETVADEQQWGTCSRLFAILARKEDWLTVINRLSTNQTQISQDSQNTAWMQVYANRSRQRILRFRPLVMVSSPKFCMRAIDLAGFIPMGCICFTCSIELDYYWRHWADRSFLCKHSSHRIHQFEEVSPI